MTMSILRTHSRVHLFGSLMFGVKEPYEAIIEKIKAVSSFIELHDYYDGTPMLFRTEDVRAVTQWTEEGCRLFYELNIGCEEIEKEVKKAKGLEW